MRRLHYNTVPVTRQVPHLTRVLTYTGHIVRVADRLSEEPVPDLPGEDARALRLVLSDLFHHGRGGDPGLGAADLPGLDRTSLVIPGHK